MTTPAKTTAAMFVIVAQAGCASVPVKKVPTPTQYALWTDQMQRQADSMKGIRFYLPRPFINVFESFPVRTDVALADGFVSSDGQYVIINNVRGTGPLAEAFNGHKDITLPKELLIPAEPAPSIPKGEEPAAGNTPGTTIPAEPPTPPTPPAPAPAPIPTVSGQARRSVTNDNSAFAYLPLRGNMDVVYLPDFEEQYVVDSVAGLGNAEFSLNLGQGWSLQGFNSLADNSELNRRLFELVDSATKVAKSAADAASGRLLPLISKAASAPGGQQDGVVTPKGQQDAFNAPAATPVSLKIVQVHYAAKGLYPVIKPRELAERTLSRPAAVTIPLWGSVTDLQASLTAAKAAETSSSFTVPRYPYQYISFNTFSYLAIEVIKTSSAPFGTLYNATGTEGASGRTDDQLRDLLRSLVGEGQTPGILAQRTTPDRSNTGTNATTNATAIAARTEALSEWIRSGVRVPADGMRFYSLKAATLDGDVVKAGLSISDAGKPESLNEAEALKAFQALLETHFKDKGLQVPTLRFTNLLGDPGDVSQLSASIVKTVRFPAKAADATPHFEVASIFVESLIDSALATVEIRPVPSAPAGTDKQIEDGLKAQLDEALQKFKGPKIGKMVLKKVK
jgi:hypothetical protein